MASAQRQNHKVVTSAAPIGGLNVADSLVAMPTTDATVLRNFFPQPYGLEVRRGTVKHATVSAKAVETILFHMSANASFPNKLFCVSDGKLFDVTAPGTSIVHTPLLSGLSNSRWEYIGISNASGYNTIMYNGMDDPIWIKDNGTVGRITSADVTGVLPNLWTGGTLHQKRMWLIEKNSTRAWYLAPEAIMGVAAQFDFGAVFTMGGTLVALASWTLDSGVGPDDLLVAISSLGEIAIYSGSDPSSIATFSLRGVFYTGNPLSPRAICKVAGDLLVLTQFGLLSMNSAMARSDTADAVSSAYLSQKIQYLLSGLASRLPSEFGWDLVNWPSNNMLLINVPLTPGMDLQAVQFDASVNGATDTTGQLVQSTITKGWAQWDNIDAVSWVAFSQTLLCGDKSGNVWRVWEGYTDGADQTDASTIVTGTPIQAECQTAFNFLGNQSSVKHAKMVRPTFTNTAKINYAIRVNPDFDYVPATAPGAVAQTVASLWGTGPSDPLAGIWGTSKWKGGMKTQKLWTAVSGMGAAFSVRLAFYTDQPVLWAAYDLMYEDGRNI